MLSQRSDSEHEQALIRLAIAVIIVGYFFTSAILDGEITQSEYPVLSLSVLILVFSIGIISWIFINLKKSVARRLLGMMTDLCASAYSFTLRFLFCAVF